MENQPPVSSQEIEAPSPSHNGQSLYAELSRALIELLQGVVKKKRLQLDELTSLVDLMVTGKSEMEELYRLALSARDDDNSLSRHMVHVATYSVKLAQGLRLSEQKIRNCALTALLHDVGMCLIPPELRHKNGRLTGHETVLLQKHPDYGYQIIKAHLGDEYQWLAEVVRQEHERENGTGYPHALSEERIDEGAKIIGVADVYEALTHDRPHRPRLLPYRAVKEIMETQKGLFSPKVLKAMLQQLSVFPLNSLVRLNSNAIARVMETHEGQPLRPTVQVLYDPKGDFIREGRVLPLRENPLLYIVDSVDETELKYS
jgi:HD-GYP domain-containing protein (c-di-GMP phosphodiesterase class II)